MKPQIVRAELEFREGNYEAIIDFITLLIKVYLPGTLALTQMLSHYPVHLQYKEDFAFLASVSHSQVNNCNVFIKSYSLG